MRKDYAPEGSHENLHKPSQKGRLHIPRPVRGTIEGNGNKG